MKGLVFLSAESRILLASDENHDSSLNVRRWDCHLFFA